jgi:hypothetical protein
MLSLSCCSLPAALNAKTAEDDLCNVGDFVCDANGQLQKLDFSNAGLVCRRFPPAIGQLPALETLMLRFNDFGGATFESVAEVRGAVAEAAAEALLLGL